MKSEVRTMGNTYNNGNIRVTLIGDVNCDDYVGIDDIFEAAMHFGEEEP